MPWARTVPPCSMEAFRNAWLFVALGDRRRALRTGPARAARHSAWSCDSGSGCGEIAANAAHQERRRCSRRWDHRRSSSGRSRCRANTPSPIASRAVSVSNSVTSRQFRTRELDRSVKYRPRHDTSTEDGSRRSCGWLRANLPAEWVEGHRERRPGQAGRGARRRSSTTTGAHRLGEAGYATPSWPKEYGGAGLDPEGVRVGDGGARPLQGAAQLQRDRHRHGRPDRHAVGRARR